MRGHMRKTCLDPPHGMVLAKVAHSNPWTRQRFRSLQGDALGDEKSGLR